MSPQIVESFFPQFVGGKPPHGVGRLPPQSVGSLASQGVGFGRMSPQDVQVLYRDRLTPYEYHEISSFKNIYFIGTNERKVDAKLNMKHNFGYDKWDGSYIAVMHDHVAYRYELIKVMGRGNFGQVYKAFDHGTRTHVALKIIRNEKRFHRQAKEEVKILEHLGQEDANDDFNVVRMLDNFKFRNHICITFELLSFSLYEVIKKNRFRGCDISLVRNFAQDLVQALDSLSKNNIIHGDVKPENILLKENGRSGVKLIDLGTACYQDKRIHSYIQSRYYRAPEIILGCHYGTAIDMWSLGCVLAELLTGDVFLAGKDEADQLAAIMETVGMPPRPVLDAATRADKFISAAGYPRYCMQQQAGANRWRGMPGSRTVRDALAGCRDKVFVDFLERCLQWDPAVRLTPSEALNHPWLSLVHRINL